MGLGAKPASPVLQFKIIQRLAQTASKPIKEILLVLYFSLLVVINITYYTIVCFIHTHTYLYILTDDTRGTSVVSRFRVSNAHS